MANEAKPKGENNVADTRGPRDGHQPWPQRKGIQESFTPNRELVNLEELNFEYLVTSLLADINITISRISLSSKLRIKENSNQSRFFSEAFPLEFYGVKK